jgi:hypothetical protein
MGFQKLAMKLCANETIKDVFLTLSPNPRFYTKSNNNSRMYNMLVWEVGFSVGFYLELFVWIQI